MWVESPKKQLVETNNIGDCLFVHLPNQASVQVFLRNSEEGGYTTEGIGLPGWYQWDGYLFAYVPIPMECLPLISN